MLLTPGECTQLPGPVKKDDKIVKAGVMLIKANGFPLIYGQQPLYFQDKTLLKRSSVPCVTECDITTGNNKLHENEEVKLKTA